MTRAARVAVTAAFFLGTPAASVIAGAQAVPPGQWVAPADSLQKQPQRESWLGPDKFKHFFMAAFIEGVAFSGVEAVGGNRNTAFATAIGTTALISLGREVHDKRTKGLFSFGDLLWDAIGATATVEMLRHTQR